jgi:hypothetical protein
MSFVADPNTPANVPHVLFFLTTETPEGENYANNQCFMVEESENANEITLAFLRDIAWMRKITQNETFTIGFYAMAVRGELLMNYSRPLTDLGAIQQQHFDKFKIALNQHVTNSALESEGIVLVTSFVVNTEMFYEATEFQVFNDGYQLSFQIHRGNEFDWIDFPMIKVPYNRIEHTRVPLHFVTEYKTLIENYIESFRPREPENANADELPE